MQHYNDALCITMYNPEQLDLKQRQYSEESLLKNAKLKAGVLKLENEEANLPMLMHNFGYSMMSKIIEASDFTLNENSEYFLKDEIQSTNFSYLFSYFSSYSKEPKITDSFGSQKLTPFTYYRFISEFVETVSFLPHDASNEHESLSKLVQHTIFSTPELCLLETVGKLSSKMRKFLKTKCGVTNFKFFDEIFTSCILKAIAHPTNANPEVRVKHEYRKLFFLRQDKLREMCPTLETQSDFLHFNTFLHERAGQVDKCWAYEKGEIDDDPSEYYSEAVQRFLFTSSLASRIKCSKRPVGNAHVMLNISQIGEPKAVTLDTGLAVKVSFINTNDKFYVISEDNEFIVPAFEKHGIKLTIFNAENKKKVLAELKLETLTKNAHEEGTFKHNSNKYKFVIDTLFFPKDNIVPVSFPIFSSGKNPGICAQFIIKLLVNRWLDAKMGSKPPMEHYTFLCDFALKYSIPASYIFFTLLNSLQLCWTSSGQFLEGYVPVLLTCYALTKKSHTTEIESDTLEVVFQSLLRTVPTLLLNALSKPDVIEKPAITELLIMLSMVYDPTKIEDYFKSIISDSTANIFESVVSALKVVESKKEASSHEVSLFTVMPHHNITPKFSNLGIPLINFTTESLIEAAKILHQRTEKLTTFFTQATLPTFADHQESITLDFKSLGVKIALIFANHDPRPSVDQIVEFLSYYRNIHRIFGAEDEMSPEKLFQPLVLGWLNDFGPRIIDLTTRSIMFDKFTKAHKTDNCSSSVYDIFIIFNDTVQFLHKLNFEESSMTCIYESYMSICASSIKLFISTTTKIFDDRTAKLANPELAVEREITAAESFIIINNILKLKEQWDIFVGSFTQKHDCSAIPVPNFEIASTINAMINDLEKQAIFIIKNSIMDKIWKKTTIFKIVSYSLKLKNDEEQHEIARIFFDALTEFIKDFQLLANTFQSKFIVNVFSGIEKGILECFIPFFEEPNNEVYSNLLSILYNSSLEIISALPEKLQRKATNELRHLEFAQKMIQKTFSELREAEIPDEDSISKLVADLTLVQLASSKKEKSEVEKICSEYRKFSFI